jgi:hypothetical protein
MYSRTLTEIKPTLTVYQNQVRLFYASADRPSISQPKCRNQASEQAVAESHSQHQY